MPFEIKPAQSNREVRVSVCSLQSEMSVVLWHNQLAYSAAITQDMRTQVRLGYIELRHLDKLPVGATYGVYPPAVKVRPAVEAPKVPQSADSTVVEPVATPTTEPSVESAPRMLTQQELTQLDPDQLFACATSFGVNPDQKKSSLIKAILKAQAKQEKASKE